MDRFEQEIPLDYSGNTVVKLQEEPESDPQEETTEPEEPVREKAALPSETILPEISGSAALAAAEPKRAGGKAAAVERRETAVPRSREDIPTIADRLALKPMPEPELPERLETEPISSLLHSDTRAVRIIYTAEELIIEESGPTGDLFLESDPENRLGLLNLFNRKGLRRLTAGILTPLGSLSPVSIYETNEERVVEVATITVSRRPVHTEENNQQKK
ncbi:MAG: hypothetical protein LUD68_04950 [Rikenellaceae bacterium]|nr:hypothetical protein [Rikenellaceae bacterium]